LIYLPNNYICWQSLAFEIEDSWWRFLICGIDCTKKTTTHSQDPPKTNPIISCE